MSGLDLTKNECARLVSALAWHGKPERQPQSDRRLIGKLQRYMASLGKHGEER